MNTVKAYIGLGANLGDRGDTINRALDELEKSPRVRVTRRSDLIETAPVGGPENQPLFLNGAAEVETDLPPRELLTLLQSIEDRLGRSHSGPRWGPRTIDLDILFYGEVILNDQDLIIPHPRLHERRFVLEPLAQIVPTLRHPRLKKTIQFLSSQEHE